MFLISTNHPHLRFSRNDAVKILRLVYKKEKKELPELAIVFTYDGFIRKINKSFLCHDYVTDIITFPLGDDGDVEAEIYINLDAAKKQAGKYKITFGEEVRRLLIHGALHLMGYDDKLVKDRKKMSAREDMYLSRFRKLN
jgi:probable rRNA maturation factor